MRTSLDGPVILYGNDNPQQISNTDAGPNADYQSNALLDSRFASQVTAAGEGANAGILAWHNTVELETLSAIPQALSTTIIAAAQAVTAGNFFTLASANALGVAVNIPLVPQGTAIQPTSAVLPVLALDFGFALATTNVTAGTANQMTITGPTPTPAGSASAVYATRFFYPGQRIIVAGAGNAAGTLPLFTTVLATDRYAAAGQALQAAGVILMANNALFAGANMQVGTSDQEYGVAAKPVVKGGALRIYDPAQVISRVVTVTASGASTGSVLVRGYDIYEQPISQNITIAGTATATGTKAFKYISSVFFNVGGTLTGTLAIGTADIIGFPTRSDEFEYTNIYAAGAYITSSTGYVPADQTSPATNTAGGSGDVRGTYALQTASNGSRRFVFTQIAPIATAKLFTNIDQRGICGVVNA
jgi:hypothetical protein